MLSSSSLLSKFFLPFLLNEKFDHDNREIEFRISIPKVGEFGIMTTPTTFWIQMAMILLIGSIVNALMAILMYFFVLLPNNHNKTTMTTTTKETSSSSSSLFVTFCIIIPVSLLAPFYFVQLLNLQNTAYIFTLMGTATMAPFHCFEALSGLTPQYATKSVWNYIAYHTSVVQFNATTKVAIRMDSKNNSTKEIKEEVIAKAPWYECWNKLYLVIYNHLEITILFSILTNFSYHPFPIKPIQSIFDLFYWGNICNNYILAYACGIFLEAGTLTFGLLITLVTGLSTTIVNNCPLTQSTSPSDFWGSRWNIQVHNMFKRSVYIPLRKRGYNKPVAALIVFFSSGLLHEYVLALLAMKQVTTGDAGFMTTELFAPTKYGLHVAFFVWNGIILCLEFYIQNYIQREQRRKKKTSKDDDTPHWITVVQNSLPQPLQTTFVLMTVLPISHWFTDEYISNGILPDFAMAFPRIVRL